MLITLDELSVNALARFLITSRNKCGGCRQTKPFMRLLAHLAYSGKYIAQRCWPMGGMITLKNSLNRPNPFGEQVQAFPFHLPTRQANSRLTKRQSPLQHLGYALTTRIWGMEACNQHLRPLQAAQAARCRNASSTSASPTPSLDSPLEHFHGKKRLEQALINSGISYAILRPTVLFGKEEIFINNIAWMLRRFPCCLAFLVMSAYRVQPIYVIRSGRNWPVAPEDEASPTRHHRRHCFRNYLP
ncbi:MAG: hypothetical protein IPH82_04310 [Chloroflexi bacterium]|nr:hypothetical protein [Chloroflexota bacterium]